MNRLVPDDVGQVVLGQELLEDRAGGDPAELEVDRRAGQSGAKGSAGVARLLAAHMANRSAGASDDDFIHAIHHADDHRQADTLQNIDAYINAPIPGMRNEPGGRPTAVRPGGA